MVRGRRRQTLQVVKWQGGVKIAVPMREERFVRSTAIGPTGQRVRGGFGLIEAAEIRGRGRMTID